MFRKDIDIQTGLHLLLSCEREFIDQIILLAVLADG
ncbi:hypothetical protein CEAn_00070 [Coxiella endosymbiont of Amblyomma nuttalli]|nr:hypothetical protein CEAn_00070 [Coxiella endosymbiont of Amblyomma nuttalli]